MIDVKKIEFEALGKRYVKYGSKWLSDEEIRTKLISISSTAHLVSVTLVKIELEEAEQNAF